MDPVVSRRNQRRKGCRRNQHGGNVPPNGAYSVDGPLIPGLGNASIIQPMSACLAVPRPSPSFSDVGIPGMKGGRYQLDFETTANGIALTNATPIPCERGGSPTIPTSPLYHGGSAPSYQAISVNTAGYTEKPSDFLSSSGTPLMLHVPVNARTCGGRRRGLKARKARKTRKTRKTRKSSRRH
jgi:hypothetical protein